jgi:hypothetical protein
MQIVLEGLQMIFVLDETLLECNYGSSKPWDAKKLSDGCFRLGHGGFDLPSESSNGKPKVFNCYSPGCY